MDILDKLGSTFSDLWDKLLDVLPKSPISYLEADPEVKVILSYVNYFIPISAFISMLEVWLVAVAAYYALQLILRWFKMIE